MSKYHPNMTDTKYDYRAPTLLVTLPYMPGTWTINYGKGHNLSGYGNEWRSYIAYYGSLGHDIVIVDWEGVEGAFNVTRRPMPDPAIVESEGERSLDYVNLTDHVRIVTEDGAKVTQLTASEAAAFDCQRCPKCNRPTYEWGGTRHRGATGVRTDNDEGIACP